MSFPKVSKEATTPSLAIATIGLVVLHNPVEANNSHNNRSNASNSATAHQQSSQLQNKYTSAAISKRRNQDHSNWMTSLTGERFTTIAHRGASGYAPEYMLYAYDKSYSESGTSYIELDLQRAKDGQLVAVHNETVDRTVIGIGRAEGYTLVQLKQLDTGLWLDNAHPECAKPEYKNAKAPTLDEILSRYGTRANHYVETKDPNAYPGMEKQLLETLKKHYMLTGNSSNHGYILIQLFSEGSL